jgi:hypothetical protein
MHTSPASQLSAVAALIVAAGFAATPVLAEEQIKGSEIPSNAYYGDTLSPSEREGIASEENVSPNDGKASVPPADLQGVIPDAADPEKGDTTVAAPPSGDLPGDVSGGTPGHPAKQAESEADVIIDDSKKNFRVTENDMAKCISQWDAQTQMSKEEWAESCRTTLQYFPEGD